MEEDLLANSHWELMPSQLEWLRVLSQREDGLKFTIHFDSALIPNSPKTFVLQAGNAATFTRCTEIFGEPEYVDLSTLL